MLVPLAPPIYCVKVAGAVWDCSLLLASFLELHYRYITTADGVQHVLRWHGVFDRSRPDLAGKRVVELGAGVLFAPQQLCCD